MSRSYVDLPPLKHSPDCFHPRRTSEGYDATGIRYNRCFGCDAFEHKPLMFRDIYLGSLSQWPDLEHTPYGHESGLLDFPRFYSNDWTFKRQSPNPLPKLKPLIGLAFNPADSVRNNDAHEHEGVSFHEVWTDTVARMIWLGYKPFMITDQYFRSYCISHANGLRKNPEALLKERVSFHFGNGLWGSSGGDAIGAQLVPYLIHALDLEGLWTYFKFSNGCLLGWRYNPARKAA